MLDKSKKPIPSDNIVSTLRPIGLGLQEGFLGCGFSRQPCTT
ncbi:hypothetical protein ACP8HI_04275 [Paenibacillus sp. FA6]